MGLAWHTPPPYPAQGWGGGVYSVVVQVIRERLLSVAVGRVVNVRAGRWGPAHSPRRLGMVVYVDDVEPVDVELLSLDEARMVLARTQAELPIAFNSAHAATLRMEIAEVEDQIAWLESEAAAEALEDAAVEHASDLWADYDLGIPA